MLIYVVKNTLDWGVQNVALQTPSSPLKYISVSHHVIPYSGKGYSGKEYWEVWGKYGKY